MKALIVIRMPICVPEKPIETRYKLMKGIVRPRPANVKKVIPAILRRLARVFSGGMVSSSFSAGSHSIMPQRTKPSKSRGDSIHFEHGLKKTHRIFHAVEIHGVLVA